MNVMEWLEENGFGEDVRLAFHMAKIDEKALNRLDDLTLQAIGVNKLGDRKRLLRLARRLHDSCCFLDQPSRTWTREDVGVWLALCGLEEYKAVFAATDITGRRLLSLDEPELRHMGIAKLGHRKQILRRASETKLRAKKRLAAYPLAEQWTMMEVCDWLKVIRSEQYRHAFVNKRITGVRLVALNDADLEELGVVLLGHRKRLIREIGLVKRGPEPLDRKQRHSASESYQIKDLHNLQQTCHILM